VRALTDTRAAAQLLAALHAEAQRAGWAAVLKAKKAGDFIRRFPPGPRGRLLRAAGVPARTASQYVSIATNWGEIERQHRHRAAVSLRSVIALRSAAPATREEPAPVYRLALDTLDPETLVRVIWPLRHRAVLATVRLRGTKRVPHPQQLALPFMV
jgi:hypothetical protein